MPSTHSLDLEAGSSQYAYINDGDQTGLDLSGDFTFEMWVKMESQPGVGGRMVLISKDDETNRSYFVEYENNAGVYQIAVIVFSDNTTYDLVRFTETLSNATWTHVAITCDISNAVATEFELFLDGVSQGNGTVVTDGSVTAIQNTTIAFKVGSGLSDGRYLDGLIEDVRVWNDIRTQPEIDTYKCLVLTGSEANLVSWWKFDNDATDSAGSNDLTLSGSPSYSTDVPLCLQTTTSTSTSTTSSSTSSSSSSTSSSSSSTSSSSTSSSSSSTSSSSSSTSSSSSSSSTSTSTSTTTLFYTPPPSIKIFDIKPVSRTMRRDTPTINITNE